MRHRYMVILSAGLFVLIAILFILVSHLSRKQHLANIQSIKDGYREALSQESSNIRSRTRTLERDALAAFDDPNLSTDFCMTNRLFVGSKGVFVPAGIPDVPPQEDVPPDVARESLSEGLMRSHSGDTARAHDHLLKASRIPIKTPEDLNVRLSALVELLKISGYQDTGILFCIFHALFNYPDIKPGETQTIKIEDALRAHVPQYEALKVQSVEMWKTAAAISLVSSNRPGPFRAVCNGQVLSVNAMGQACLLPMAAFSRDSSNSMIRITATAPGEEAAVSYQMRYPALHVWIPAQEFETRKQSMEHAYLLTKLLLGILLAVIVGMGLGIGVIIKRLHEMSVLRSSFVSTVSHELRTPMALIRLYAESLSSGNTPPGTKDNYTRAIMAETDRLTALVNNVLDFTRLERGIMTLNVRTTDISKVCGEALDSFNFRMEKEKVTLTRHIEPGMKALVDPLALTQVIFNLVDNAIKYSQGKRRIEVELTPAGDKISLRVKDDGIGIPDSLKKRIFMPFVRGEDDRVTAQRGSGIGLSIVSRLLERMQCSITCFDNVPEGTVFEIIMPKDLQS